MIASILSFLTGAVAPIVNLIDELHTSDEERLKLKNELMSLVTALTAKIIEFETHLVDAQKSVLTAEASSTSWLTANWRPIAMMTFLVLVLADAFMILPVRPEGVSSALPQEAWTLLQYGLGGYVAGRSLEKAVGGILEKIGKR